MSEENNDEKPTTYEDIFEEIKKKLDSSNKKKSISLYAFNGVGKTTISKLFDDLNDNENNERISLVYNAFFEDYFYWDNEELTLKINRNSNIGDILKELENFKEVENYFNYLINSKINIEEIEEYDKNIKANILTGFRFNYYLSETDEDSINIKISRGEESLFVWSIYFNILKSFMIKISDGEKKDFDYLKKLKYIVIDDPVSSLDENNLISICIDLINLINEYNLKDLKFLLTTHHPLFYNTIKKSNIIIDKKKDNLILKKTNSDIKLENSKKYSFGYHLFLINELTELFNSEDKNIKKYHFNMFRNILEKTSNYLGYQNLEDCISIEKKDMIKKYINEYSHNNVSDLEYSEVNEESKQLLEEAFNKFKDEFHFNIKNE